MKAKWWIILTCVLFSSYTVLGAPKATVERLKGKVTYEGKTLKVGDEINTGGIIKTASSSFVKIMIEKWGSALVVGPKSELLVVAKAPTPIDSFKILQGTLRYKTRKKGSEIGGIMTTRASMGVRGTNFFVKVNKLLGETEIVLFKGKVQMTNTSDKSDSLLIKDGQWGGIGGRFGEKLKQPIDLPKEALDGFNRFLDI